MSATKSYKLGKPFDNFTGTLNNVYPVKDGIVTLSIEAREPTVLIDHYGAKRVFNDAELKQMREQMAAAEAAQKAEMEKAEAAAKAEAEAKAKTEAAAAAAAGTSEAPKTNW